MCNVSCLAVIRKPNEAPARFLARALDAMTWARGVPELVDTV
ncbi:hypothetical protein B398_08620 [Xylella fastidiosa 32]|nr:hypothetical protein B398_08620 [Xylella fastidiosa 32]